MLDLRLIREQPDQVKAALATLNAEAPIDEILAFDANRRALLTEVEALKAERNEGSKLVTRTKDPAERQVLIANLRELGDRIAALDEEAKAVDVRLHDLLLLVPNLPLPEVPIGPDESANVVVAEHGERRAFAFPPKPHWDLCAALGLADFERGAKLAGAGFVLYTGIGARLERALITFMLDLHTAKHGYTELGLPFALSRESITASGHIVKFGPEMYRDDEADLFFVPTAEPALVNVHRGEILEPGVLPLKYVAYTPCWRREAGAAGRDTRGLLRVHQFDKVELFRYALPETSYDAQRR